MEQCSCKFIAVGVALNNSDCKIHDRSQYACDLCNCPDYRPSKEKRSPTHWPVCVCGHSAHGHNNESKITR